MTESVLDPQICTTTTAIPPVDNIYKTIALQSKAMVRMSAANLMNNATTLANAGFAKALAMAADGVETEKVQACTQASEIILKIASDFWQTIEKS